MTSSIILKKSSVASRVPVVGDLAYGELALNYADGALYYKRSDNTIQNLIVASSGGGGGGGGTVTSVGISVPTGLSVSNTPVTASGTIAITLTSGYSIPTTASQTNWDTAYGWGNHASAGYLTSSSLTGYLTTSTAATTYQPLSTNLNSWSTTAVSVKQDTLVSGTNIKTINGTSLLGSGDITITGGGGGSGVTNTVVTATTQTASINTRYILTNAATSTLTLPPTPAQGDVVYVVVANNLLTNVIARNSEKIMGVAEDLTIDNPVASFGLIYINSTLGWRFL